MFIKIYSMDGSCHHIKTDQISLVMKDKNNQCWIVIGQHSIQIGLDEYDQMMIKFNEWWNIDEIKSQHKIPQDLKIEDLQLSIRLANCLSNMGVVYLHQLLKYTATELLRSKNFGRKSLNEITEVLQEYNCKLGELK
jgi:DNA-directed RNA polymerase subunit alpha